MIKNIADLSSDEEKYKDKVWFEIESLINCYIELTPEQRVALKDKVLSEAEDQIALARRIGITPFELEQERVRKANEKIREIRKIELNGYTLGIEEFWEKFESILSSVSFFPSPVTITLAGTTAREAIYRASSPEPRESYEACNQLLGICDPKAVQGFSKAIRENYEILRKSKILRYTEVRAVNSRLVCDKCVEQGDKHLSTDALLNAYELGVLPFPHELPSEGEFRWCSGPKLLLAPNDDFGLR
ncbi:hypothetical protein [Vreelandella lionensis]|uniref:hypothetical protein n=1 Tax=Halomonadaceae TaxID=28256 RepID=UPI0009F5463C|nr:MULTISPECIES: hypothetical protein [Halomonas]MCP1318388.1 hypothetical protein [Halomonas sp. 707B3]